MNTDGSGKLDVVPIDYTVNTMCAILASLDAGCFGDIYQIGVMVHHPGDTLLDTWDYVHYHPDWKYGKRLPRIKYVTSKLYFDVAQWLKYDVPLYLLWPAVWLNRALYGGKAEEDEVDRDKWSEVERAQHELSRLTPSKLTSLARKIEFGAEQRRKLAQFHADYVYFYNLKIIFDTKHVDELYGCLDQASKDEFYFDTREFDKDRMGLDTALKAAADLENMIRKRKHFKAKRKKELLEELQRLRGRVEAGRDNKAVMSKL